MKVEHKKKQHVMHDLAGGGGGGVRGEWWFLEYMYFTRAATVHLLMIQYMSRYKRHDTLHHYTYS